MGKDTKMQKNWCWCSKCEGLFYLGTEWMSYCPAGGEHDDSFNSAFTYSVNTDHQGEANWRRCTRCQVLYFEIPGTLLLTVVAPCPAPGKALFGAVHDSDGSIQYFVEKNNLSDTSVQHGWKYCKKCFGLFFGGHATQGKCPGGGAHDGAGSADYSLYVE